MEGKRITMRLTSFLKNKFRQVRKISWLTWNLITNLQITSCRLKINHRTWLNLQYQTGTKISHQDHLQIMTFYNFKRSSTKYNALMLIISNRRIVIYLIWVDFSIKNIYLFFIDKLIEIDLFFIDKLFGWVVFYW
jgi:hypothetical protein